MKVKWNDKDCGELWQYDCYGGNGCYHPAGNREIVVTLSWNDPIARVIVLSFYLPLTLSLLIGTVTFPRIQVFPLFPENVLSGDCDPRPVV